MDSSDNPPNMAYDKFGTTNHLFIVAALSDFDLRQTVSLMDIKYNVLNSDGKPIILATDSTSAWSRGVEGYNSDRNFDITLIDPNSGSELYTISSRSGLLQPSVTVKAGRIRKDNQLLGLIQESGKYEELKYEICDSRGNLLFIIRPGKKYSPTNRCPSVWRTAFPTYGDWKFRPREYILQSPDQNLTIGIITTQWRDKIYRKSVKQQQLENKRKRKGIWNTIPVNPSRPSATSESYNLPTKISIENMDIDLEYDSSSCDEDLAGIDYFQCTRSFGIEFLSPISPYSKSLILGGLFMIFYRCLLEASTISYAEQKSIAVRQRSHIYAIIICVTATFFFLFVYFSTLSEALSNTS